EANRSLQGPEDSSDAAATRKRSVARSCTRSVRTTKFARRSAKNSCPAAGRAQLLHVLSTGYPHRRPMKRRTTAILFALMAAAPGLAGQTRAAPATTSTFRFFLSDGRSLPSYGESTVVADRVIFMLPIGDANAHVELQLMSLPASSVDVGRTVRYAESVRAAHYAATRGEADYAAITNELAGALESLTKMTDAKRRLAMAEDARGRLTS